jgi:YD repeat-containing protein
MAETLSPAIPAGRPLVFLSNDLSDVEIFEYNSLNQLTESLSNGIMSEYSYRPDGLRHSKNATTHLWDGSNIVGDVVGGDVTKYIRGIGLIANRDATNAFTYYLHDAHGSVVQLTDNDGEIVKTYDYDAFGNEVSLDPSDTNPFRYCGEYFDGAATRIIEIETYEVGEEYECYVEYPVNGVQMVLGVSTGMAHFHYMDVSHLEAGTYLLDVDVSTTINTELEFFETMTDTYNVIGSGRTTIEFHLNGQNTLRFEVYLLNWPAFVQPSAQVTIPNTLIQPITLTRFITHERITRDEIIPVPCKNLI